MKEVEDNRDHESMETDHQDEKWDAGRALAERCTLEKP